MIYLGHLSETLESLSPSKLTDLELLPSDSSLCLGATFLLLFRLFVLSFVIVVVIVVVVVVVKLLTRKSPTLRIRSTEREEERVKKTL